MDASENAELAGRTVTVRRDGPMAQSANGNQRTALLALFVAGRFDPWHNRRYRENQKIVMTTKPSSTPFLVAMVLVLLMSRSVAGQAFEMIAPTGQISREGYKTWSLFLVCNPDWLLPEKSSELFHLYWQFQVFGRTIGDDNLAVWFWKERAASDDPRLAENVDVERSIRFCRELNLRPSLGPHLVMMHEYPDETALPSERMVFELGGLEAIEISRLLRRLTDELLLEGRVRPQEVGEESAVPPVEREPVSSWIRFLEVAQRAIVGFGCRINVQIQTGLLSAQLRECAGP